MGAPRATEAAMRRALSVWQDAGLPVGRMEVTPERRHADALADTLYSMDGLQSIDCEMRDNAVQQHRARRQG